MLLLLLLLFLGLPESILSLTSCLKSFYSIDVLTGRALNIVNFVESSEGTTFSSKCEEL